MAADATTLIKRVNKGDQQAEGELVAELYQELQRLARGAMRGERPNHTLQSTALVNEALMRLLGESIEYQDRLHFLRLCATTMRRVLVDHARSRSAQKRGANKQQQVTLDASQLGEDAGGGDLAFIALHEAMERLEAQDPRKARVIELHFFSGLAVDEIADLLGASESTVARDVRFSRAWLKSELGLGQQSR